MNSVKCARCGLVNWIEGGECKRCGNSLAFLEEVKEEVTETTAEASPVDEGARVCSFCGTEFRGYFCPLCRKHARVAPAPGREVERSVLTSLLPSLKIKIAVALVLLMATGGVLFAASRFGVGGRADKFQAELIQKSEAFAQPVTVSFSEKAETPAPGVEVLREVGLVRIRTGETETARPVPHLLEANEQQEEQAAPERVSFTRVELTAEGLKEKESGGWKSTEAKPSGDLAARAEGERVWAVPLGEREFLEIKKVYPVAVGVYEVSTVEFTWRWKPNRVGLYFDVRSGEHASLTETVRRGAATLGLDSAATREGKATLRYDGKQWAVRDITFESGAPATAANQ